MLSNAQWAHIEHLLPGKPTDKGGRAANNRLFVEAVLYTARVGNPWRDLPAEFGNWRSVYVRFARWETYGIWDRVAKALRENADLEELFIDATIVRAHQHSAGAPKKRWRSSDRPLEGRTDHQDPRLCRRTGQPVAPDPDGRTRGRRHARGCPGVGHSDRGGHRRQGIRQQRPDRDHRRLGCPGDHRPSARPTGIATRQETVFGLCSNVSAASAPPHSVMV